MVRMMCRATPLVVLCGAMWSAVALAGTVSPEALAQARRDGDVAVIVALRAPTVAPRVRGERAHRLALERLRRAVLDGLPADEVEVAHVYRSLAGFSGRLSARALERLADDPDVVSVDLDQVGHAALQGSVPQIGADRVHARGVDGSGVTIAVLDAGVEAAQPDIADALVAEACFCRAGRVSASRTRGTCCPGGAQAEGPGSAAAVNEHGPHVAGIAVSRGRVASPGVAPGARLVAVRVLDAENQGFVSDWVAALDWIASERPDVRVVNMSLVSAELFSGDCERGCGGRSGCAANLLFADAMEQLWARGALVVAAAGNQGRRNGMSSPACVSRAVAVGAVDETDSVWEKSNSSRTLDLLAPGVEIVSDGLDGELQRLTGTSMAAPH
ncbi:MAG: S8 family peptidase, partial [Candidatus Binatia bacterium]